MSRERSRYTAPDGTEIRDPAPDDLGHLLRTRGADYWNVDSGTAGLRWLPTGATLMLLVTPDIGVLVLYGDPDGSNEYVLNDRSVVDAERRVTMVAGGEPWVVPRRYLVDVDHAMAAIRWFLADGSRTPGDWVVLGSE